MSDEYSSLSDWLLSCDEPSEQPIRLELWQRLIKRPEIKKALSKTLRRKTYRQVISHIKEGNLALREVLDADEEFFEDEVSEALEEQLDKLTRWIGSLSADPESPSPASCGPASCLGEIFDFRYCFNPDSCVSFVTKDPAEEAFLQVAGGGQYSGLSIDGTLPLKSLLLVALDATNDDNGQIVNINEQPYYLRVTPADQKSGQCRRELLPLNHDGKLVEHRNLLCEETEDGLVPRFIVYDRWEVQELADPNPFVLDGDLIYQVQNDRRIPRYRFECDRQLGKNGFYPIQNSEPADPGRQEG